MSRKLLLPCFPRQWAWCQQQSKHLLTRCLHNTRQRTTLQNQLCGALAAASLLLVSSAQPYSQRCNAGDGRAYGRRGWPDAGWLHHRAASVQNVSLKRDQVVVCQIGDISCWIITVFQLWGKVTNTFKQMFCWIYIQVLLFSIRYTVVNDYCFSVG